MRDFLRRNASFIVSVALLLVVRGTFADQNVVPSGSMEPTIEVGDHIFVNRLAYDLKVPFTEITLATLHSPKRGDIIVFHNPTSDVRMVKRLIGLPGDKLRIHNGFVTVNGRPAPDTPSRMLEASHDGEFTYSEKIGEHNATIKRIRAMSQPQDLEITVPPGQYFAMGDNRDNSYDSRGWGFIPHSKIVGRADFVMFNMNWNPFPSFNLDRIVKWFT